MRDRLHSHCVTLLRMAPSTVTHHLEAGEQLRLVRGLALVELSFTRRIAGAARWLPAACAPTSDFLRLCLAIEGASGATRRTLHEVAVKSWLRKPLGYPALRLTTSLTDSTSRFELSVSEGERELCHLAGEAAATPGGSPGSSVFASTRSAAEYLGWKDDENSALEALCVLDLRCPWLDQLPEAIQVDSAFRAVRVRRDALRARDTIDLARTPVEPLAAPYLPTY